MKRLFSFSVVCIAMAIAPFASAQVVTTPIEFLNVEGNSGGDGTALGNFDNTVQTVYNASLLSAAGLNVGDELTGLRFRLNAVDNAPIWSVEDYQIRLATSNFSAGDLRNDFVANRGADYTVVRSGELTLDGTEFDTSSTAGSTGPGTPNAFGPEFVFNDATFIYNGGDLLLEYTHTEIDNSLNSPGVQQTGRADGVTGFDGVQTLFGRDFDATERGFGTEGVFDVDGTTLTSAGSVGFAPIVQFTVASAVPEPSSAALLVGIGMIGALRRRRK